MRAADRIKGDINARAFWAVRGQSAYRSDEITLLIVDRPGPEVPDHRQVRCRTGANRLNSRVRRPLPWALKNSQNVQAMNCYVGVRLRLSAPTAG
jgi:hypothetical protein